MIGSPDMIAQLNYIEFAGGDLAATKTFYTDVFGWVFTDYGPTYASFGKAQAGLDGGFDTSVTAAAPGALVVFYAKDLEAVLAKVKAADGEIVREIFDFPGGRRFHFKDPAGNELAVWSDPV
ncbi:MAG: VOC family protein [Parvularculaceae bacterium]